MNSLAELRDFFIECERKFPVADWQFEGVDLWPLLRIEMRFLITRRDIFSKSDNESAALRSNVSVAWNFLKRMIGTLDVWPGNDDKDDNVSPRDVLFFTGGLGYLDYYGKAYEKFCDPFQEILSSEGYSSIRLDFASEKVKNRFSSSLYIQQKLSLYLLIRLPFFRIAKLGLNDLPMFEAFIGFCKIRNVEVASFSENFLRLRLRKILLAKDFFNGILNKVTPKVVIITNYYNDFSFALINACRERSISTMDVQHGVQGEYHTAYGHWTKVPTNGFNVLPDFFWCWSQEEVNVINLWSKSLPRHRALPGGNLFLAKYKDKSSSFLQPLLEDFEVKRSEIKVLKREKKTILVTLQTGLIEVEHLRPLITAHKTHSDRYNWMFRLHPAMVNDQEAVEKKLAGLGFKGVEFSLSTTTNLYVLLHYVDAHITHSSSVVLEAESYGVPSFIISEYGKSLYARERSEELRKIIPEGDQLVLALQEYFEERTDKLHLPEEGLGAKAYLSFLLEGELSSE